ncbi:MAG TPA: NUDIX domain-containing protein [Pseudonocardiaceae bacterium]|nr:NUDIX domain-containing protein [Pseudonocardiaceae bacterium]
MNLAKPRQPALRFFSREDLEPRQPASMTAGASTSTWLTADESWQLENFCDAIATVGRFEFRSNLDKIPAHLRMFVSTLAALGAVRISHDANSAVVENSGRLSKHVPQILRLYIFNGYSLINNWDRSGVIEQDQLNAIEFVHQLELRRIQLDKQAGIFPPPLAERPVAFGVFHARDESGESCYLFEINKDWHKLNFIGGKQEPEDDGRFDVTLKREISEELGISPQRVALSQLNDQPIIGYSLSGNAGSLARYPCVLFGVSVTGEFGIRQQDRWITERTIREYQGLPDSPMMVNPAYLTFLLSGRPSQLERTPLTTAETVRAVAAEHGEHAPQRGSVVTFIKENKELVAAVLTLVAALITILSVF